ncbi:hypothetical protein PR003_g20422 [Phytophthora rubi]|uniref:Uncharacterized protein n=1 Tax=Phytophthora rubi TaxID=129364 RepID=A0A6A4DPA2_9STRA|nr:hypothetical protein PR003_g20422 [Phytophthora rubi]
MPDTRLVLGGSLSGHILTPNSTVESDGQLKCLLCRMRGFQKRSRWGCAVCQVGFHVECFAVFHFRDAFEHDSTPSVREALNLFCASAPGNGQFKTRTKKNKSITPLPMIRLPASESIPSPVS